MLNIRLVKTLQELESVYRLRYQVYIKELGADMKYADHLSQELCKPWDATGEVDDQFQLIKKEVLI